MIQNLVQIDVLYGWPHIQGGLNIMGRRMVMMNRYNASKIVENSNLITTIKQKHGEGWRKISWVRAIVTRYIDSLGGTSDTDAILDDMEEMVQRIKNYPVQSKYDL